LFGFPYSYLSRRHLHIQAALKRAQSTAEKIRLKPLRKKLVKNIARLRNLQATYTPSALVHLATLNLNPDVLPEDVPLLLPSSLPPSYRNTDGCNSATLELEQRLRHAQCKDSLVRLRGQLQIKQRLLIYKKRQSRHQGANTRSRGLIARNESKIKRFADQYQSAWTALGVLEGEQLTWPQLRPADIRGLEDQDELTEREAKNRRQIERRLRLEQSLIDEGLIVADEQSAIDEIEEEGDEEVEVEELARKKAGTGEGKRTVSWIWTLAGTSGTDATLQDGGFISLVSLCYTNVSRLGLRMEWAKAYARTRRWQEEVRILEEEWRRVPLSLEYEAARWDTRAQSVSSIATSKQLQDGMTAYACKQAEMFRDLIAQAEAVRTEDWKGRGHRRATSGFPRSTKADAVSTSAEMDTTEESAGPVAFEAGDDDDDPEDSDYDSDSDSEEADSDVDGSEAEDSDLDFEF
jgi:hypothetical protein